MKLRGPRPALCGSITSTRPAGRISLKQLRNSELEPECFGINRWGIDPGFEMVRLVFAGKNQESAAMSSASGATESGDSTSGRTTSTGSGIVSAGFTVQSCPVPS